MTAKPWEKNTKEREDIDLIRVLENNALRELGPLLPKGRGVTIEIVRETDRTHARATLATRRPDTETMKTARIMLEQIATLLRQWEKNKEREHDSENESRRKKNERETAERRAMTMVEGVAINGGWKVLSRGENPREGLFHATTWRLSISTDNTRLNVEGAMDRNASVALKANIENTEYETRGGMTLTDKESEALNWLAERAGAN